MKENIFFSALSKGKMKKAKKVLNDLKGELSRKRYLYLEGRYLESTGELKEALKRFDMALVLHLSDETLWLAKARVLMEMGKLDIAKRAAERACRLAGDRSEPHLLYSEILYRTKEYQKSMEHIDAAIEAGENSAQALTLKGILISILDQDYKEALMFFDSAIDADSEYPRAWTNRGMALRQIGDNDGSIYSFQRAVLIDPSDKNARKMLSNLGYEGFIESIDEKDEEPDNEDILEWD